MTTNTQVENLKALTSLRFVAAFLIIAHHAPSLMTWSWPRFFPGTSFHGVSFFFVLSGFILTHVYSSKPMPAYSTFMRARFARLWPVHVVGIIFLVLSVTHDSITFDGPGVFSKWVVLGFNLSLLHSVFPFLAYTFSWNAVSWSISTEMFFYLLFPFLIPNIEKTWHLKLMCSGVVAILLIGVLFLLGLPSESENIMQATASYATYPNPFMRCFEFSTGMATWVFWNRHLRGLKLPTATWTILEIVVIFGVWYWLVTAYWFAAPYFNEWTVLWYGPAGSFWVFAILIAVFASGRGVISKILSLRPFVFLGEISFSIYMLHQILMKAFVTTFEWRDVPVYVYFPALLILASASYLCVEKPGQRLLLGTRPRNVVIDSPVRSY